MANYFNNVNLDSKVNPSEEQSQDVTISQPHPVEKPTSPVPTQQSLNYAVEPQPKQRMVAALLAIFLGTFGIHKFYIGNKKAGIIYCVISVGLCWLAGIPTIIMEIIGIIEGIQYLTKTKTDEEFNDKYVNK